MYIIIYEEERGKLKKPLMVNFLLEKIPTIEGSSEKEEVALSLGKRKGEKSPSTRSMPHE